MPKRLAYLLVPVLLTGCQFGAGPNGSSFTGNSRFEQNLQNNTSNGPATPAAVGAQNSTAPAGSGVGAPTGSSSAIVAGTAPAPPADGPAGTAGTGTATTGNAETAGSSSSQTSSSSGNKIVPGD